eukprot:COSAG01_NODE_2670_length_7274_cov_4.395540_7_plen_207_part_00
MPTTGPPCPSARPTAPCYYVPGAPGALELLVGGGRGRHVRGGAVAGVGEHVAHRQRVPRQPQHGGLAIGAPCTRCLRHGDPMHAQERLTSRQGGPSPAGPPPAWARGWPPPPPRTSTRSSARCRAIGITQSAVHAPGAATGTPRLGHGGGGGGGTHLPSARPSGKRSSGPGPSSPHTSTPCAAVCTAVMALPQQASTTSYSPSAAR